jgi:TonB-linked SusC/RagA family outer membrane protein
MLISAVAIGQTKVVTGRVTDQQGLPVPYATVKIKESKGSTVADADGNYSIKVNAGETLIFSGTGLVTKEVVVGSSNTVDVSISRKDVNLTEVVVTALGIKKESKALGYSTATLSSEQLNISKPINVAQGLIGQVAGAQVSIINNGVDPEIRIQLRGERHINADNQALLVVDGALVPNSFLATINPEDIETTSILKGATAAALYGSEATNGVLLVTTKRGSKNGKPSITFNQTVTVERMAYFPALQTTYSGYGGESGVFFAGTPYQFNSTNPFTGFTNYIPFENQSFGPAFDNNPALGYIGSPDINGNVFKTPFAVVGTDPRRAFFVDGVTTQTDASVSTGDAKNSNFLSLQYVNVKGTTPNDIAKRATARFAGKRTYGIFSYDYTVSYTNKMSNTVGNDFTGQPVYWSLLNTPANIPIKAMRNWQDPASPGNINNYYNAYYANPYWAIDNSRNINKSDNFQGTLAMNIKPQEWITGTYRVSAELVNNVYQGYRNLAQFTGFFKTDPWGEGNYQSGGNVPGAVTNQTTLQRRLQQDIFVTLQHKFGDINATLVAGNTIWDRYLSSQYQSTGNLYIPNLYNINFATGIPGTGTPITSTGGNQGISETRLIGWYGDLSLNYKDFLFLHGNYRRDLSSLLAPGRNSYDVYAVDGAWAFTDNFKTLTDNNIFSFGKIRAAYSQTGQITLSPYSTVNTFGVTGGYPYGSLASLSISSVYNNPTLTPEQTNEYEVGIDLGFLNNRLNVTGSYYHDDNSKQLFPVSLSTSTGYTNATVNAAHTVSTGYEIDAKYAVIRSKSGFRWDVAGNLQIQETKVIGLYGGAQFFPIGNSNEAIVGYSFPQMFVQDFNRDPASGKVIVDKVTGLPSVNPTFIPVGRTTPHYIMGLTTTLMYKNFSLQIIGDYRGGYVFYNNAELNLDFTGASAHTASNGRQNFIYPNSVIDAGGGKYVPNTSVYVQDGNIGFWAYSAYRKAGAAYVENAAAWKVRTINLSYDFTPMFKKYQFVKGVRVSAVCNNALMFRPKENDFTDPEFNASNANGLGLNTYNQLPPTRQFTFILALKF